MNETKERTDTESVPAKFETGFPGEEDLQAETTLSERAVNAFFETASPREQTLAVGLATLGLVVPLCPRCFKPLAEEERSAFIVL